LADTNIIEQADQSASTAAPTLRSQGAELLGAGVRYRTWCKHDRADALIRRQATATSCA
jgi:hypothetical protein